MVGPAGPTRSGSRPRPGRVRAPRGRRARLRPARPSAAGRRAAMSTDRRSANRLAAAWRRRPRRPLPRAHPAPRSVARWPASSRSADPRRAARSCDPLPIDGDDASIGIKRRTHRLDAAMEPGLHGPEWQAKDPGDLDQRKALDVVEHHDRPFLHAEAPERSLELVAIEEARKVVGPRVLIERELAYLDGAPLPDASRLAMTGPNQDPMEPRVEAIGVPERREVAPGGDECLLGRVPRPIRIAEHELGDRVEARDRPERQLVERVSIARHGPLDEDPIHRTSATRRMMRRARSGSCRGQAAVSPLTRRKPSRGAPAIRP